MRYAVSLRFVSGAGHFPWATLIVNVFGSLLIGVCYVLVFEKKLLPETLRPFLMVGFLGALTTFSTFSLEAWTLFNDGYVKLAIVNIIANITLNLVAVGIAIALTQKLINT